MNWCALLVGVSAVVVCLQDYDLLSHLHLPCCFFGGGYYCWWCCCLFVCLRACLLLLNLIIEIKFPVAVGLEMR